MFVTEGARDVFRGVKCLESRALNTKIRERLWIDIVRKDADEPAAWRKCGTPNGGLTNGRNVGSIDITDSEKQEDG